MPLLAPQFSSVCANISATLQAAAAASHSNGPTSHSIWSTTKPRRRESETEHANQRAIDRAPSPRAAQPRGARRETRERGFLFFFRFFRFSLGFLLVNSRFYPFSIRFFSIYTYRLVFNLYMYIQSLYMCVFVLIAKPFYNVEQEGVKRISWA